jgi:hypothetical protein
VIEGRATREQALRRYGAFSDAHGWKYRSLLYSQRAIGRLTTTRAVPALARAMERRRLSDWAFEHYMRIAPPAFVDGSPPRSVRGRPAAVDGRDAITVPAAPAR